MIEKGNFDGDQTLFVLKYLIVIPPSYDHDDDANKMAVLIVLSNIECAFNIN